MDGTTELDAPLKYLIISRWWNDISKEQSARDQIYSVKDSAVSGIQTELR